MKLSTIFAVFHTKSIPMSRILCLFVALTLAQLSSAQLLITTPSFPRDTTSISFTVDCSKGNQGLFNYANTSDVYVHVGVITNLSSTITDWKYVKFTWATTDPAARATSLGSNKYQYTINNIRNFFAVPAAEQILAVSVLFRNGAGTLVQRNIDASDMYIRTYTSAFAGKFLLPPFQPKYAPIPEPINKFVGDSLKISWLSNNTADIKLFFNGTQINAVSSSNLISDSVLISNSGLQTVKIQATSGANTITDSFEIGRAHV